MLTINIGISHCLLGAQVRYDGKGKRSIVCSSTLANDYNLLPICPEVEAGLSIPRPAVELVQYPLEIKALGCDDRSVDVTSTLRQFCSIQVPQLTNMSGFILTPRSPSCGLNTVAIKSPHGPVLNTNGSGLFAQSLVDHYPSLPVIEAPELSNEKVLCLFQLQVIFYYLIQHTNVLVLKNHVDNNLSNLLITINRHTEKQAKMSTIKNLLISMNQQQLKNCLHQLRALLND